MKRGVHEDDFPWDSPIAGPDGKEVYTLLTTGGHIDEFARFADDSTILMAQVDTADLADDPIARENLIRLAENLKIAQAARQPNGRPFRILMMPMPKTIVRTLRPGDVTYDLTATMPFTKKPFPKGQPILGAAAASYLNFLITNDIVIAQRYGQTGDPANIARDEQAQQVLQTAFPTRRIIMLDALAINWGGGGIHCITAHQPK
jgi:agmatine deiminase